MQQEKIMNEITTLPPEAQKQVIDFISFLRARYKEDSRKKNLRRSNLSEESFIGLWRNRKDMEDSRSWIRDIRRIEWRGPGA
jgi:hypothetical protein